MTPLLFFASSQSAIPSGHSHPFPTIPTHSQPWWPSPPNLADMVGIKGDDS